MKNESPKTGFGTILGSILGDILDKIQAQKWSKSRACLGWRFGGISVDFGVHFGLDFGTFWAWEGEKGRTGKKVKMSTALRRDAHFRGLMGLEIGPKPSRNRKWDIHFSREDSGAHLGGILDDLGLQK